MGKVYGVIGLWIYGVTQSGIVCTGMQDAVISFVATAGPSRPFAFYILDLVWLASAILRELPAVGLHFTFNSTCYRNPARAPPGFTFQAAHSKSSQSLLSSSQRRRARRE